jgi:low temperature requirement protein LtrA
VEADRPRRSIVPRVVPHVAHPSRAESRRRPRLRTAPGEPGTGTPRHATTFELFFDLVFVVAVAELADALLHHPTAAGLGRYVALFVPVWWAWVGYTFYADRFDNDDAVQRLLMVAAMLAVASLAVAIPDAFRDARGSAQFASSYVAVRALLIALYLRAHWLVPEGRPLTARYITGFVAGATLWLGSLALPPPARYALWAAGLAIELATPLLSASAIARVPFHGSHIPERFGLFTLIVLGEAVALGALGIGQTRLVAAGGLVAGGAFLVVTAQWWLYFECVDTSPLRQWRRTGQAYVYGHLLVFASLAATGVGGLLATRAAGRGGGAAGAGGAGRASGGAGALAAGERWVLCLGVAGFLVAVGLIHLVNTPPRGDVRAWTRLGLAAAIVLLAAGGGGLGPVAIVVLLLAGLCAQVAGELMLIDRDCVDIDAIFRE